MRKKKKKRNGIVPSCEFPKVEKMLYRLAWDFNARGLDFNDCLSEAFRGFLLACKSYQPGTGYDFPGWVWLRSWGTLKKFEMRLRFERSRTVCVTEANGGMIEHDMLEHWEGGPRKKKSAVTINERTRFVLKTIDMIQHLSEDACVITSLLLDTPKELCQTEDSGIVGAIVNHLEKRHRYCRKRLERAVMEMETKFREVWT